MKVHTSATLLPRGMVTLTVIPPGSTISCDSSRVPLGMLPSFTPQSFPRCSNVVVEIGACPATADGSSAAIVGFDLLSAGMMSIQNAGY